MEMRQEIRREETEQGGFILHAHPGGWGARPLAAGPPHSAEAQMCRRRLLTTCVTSLRGFRSPGTTVG